MVQRSDLHSEDTCRVNINSKITSKRQSRWLVICVLVLSSERFPMSWVSSSRAKPKGWELSSFMEQVRILGTPADILLPSHSHSLPWPPLPALFLLEQPRLPHHGAGLGWAQGHCFEFYVPSPVRQRAKGCADTTCLSPAGLGWIRVCHRSLQGLQSCPVKRIFVNSHFKSHSISIMLSPWDFFSVPANLPGFLTYK